MKHIWKIKRLLLSKRRKMQNVIFQKSQKRHARWDPRKATYSEHSIAFKGGLRNHRTGYCPSRAPRPGGEQFLWFLKTKLTSFDFTLFYSLFDNQTFVFEMCLLRSTLANLCPIMIHFNALDVNVCRSFFWRSVYEIIQFRAIMQHLLDKLTVYFWNCVADALGQNRKRKKTWVTLLFILNWRVLSSETFRVFIL